MSTVMHPRYGKTIIPTDLRKGLPGIYWGNFFGPTITRDIGKDKLLRLPCEKVLALPDNGILLILYPSPNNPSKQMHRDIQRIVRSTIGESLFSTFT
jgi:hypothetical protein